MNNLTGRSRHSPRHCPVSADAIASQLVKNGKYEASDRKSSRLVFQEVSDLWRATTPDAVNIFGTFSQREFTAALQHLKPGKAPGPDSICPELILHAGGALKSWLRDFLSSCLRRLKIPKIWRRALVVAIPSSFRRRLKGIHSRLDTNRTGAEGLSFYYPRLLHCLNQMLAVVLLSQHRVSSSKIVAIPKPTNPVGYPKSYRLISLLCVLTRFSRGLFTPALNH